MSFRDLLIGSIACGVTCFSAAIVRADTTLWSTNSSGSFPDPANWTSGVPNFDDTALFNRGNGVTYTVNFPGGTIFQPPSLYTSAVLNFGTNNVTFAQSFSPILSSPQYSTDTIIMGAPSGPSLLNSQIANLVGTRATIGLIGSPHPTTLNVRFGSFIVTGTSQPETEFTIGNDGAGTLNVFNGARAEVTGANGNVVLGANPGINGRVEVIAGTWNLAGSNDVVDELAIGEDGLGTMIVTAGGQVNISGADGNAVLGAKAGASGTVGIAGIGSAWNNNSNRASAPLVVGDAGSGTMNVSAAGHVNNFDAVIGRHSGAIGTVNVAHAGSNWVNRGILYVGGNISSTGISSGSGTLNVHDDGKVRCQEAYVGLGIGSQGVVNVARGGRWIQETDLRIGGLGSSIGGPASGSGMLHVSDGGLVETGRNASIGRPGAATVKVEDNGSRWEIGGELEVRGVGIVNIAGGGEVASNSAINNGTVNVTGLSSKWNVADFLYLGGNAPIFSVEEAVLNVNSGGSVVSPLALVGAGGVGRAYLDGIGSSWTVNEQMFIGLDREGQVVVTGGAHVRSGLVQIGVGVGSVGLVSVHGAGSSWQSTQGLYVGAAGTGELRVMSGGVLAVGGGAGIPNGPLSISLRGKVQGNSTIIADVTNGGTVAPGITPNSMLNDTFGTLDVDGHYTQLAAGMLDIEIQSPVLFDKLDIGGQARLGGALNVSSLSFLPATGSTFEILRAGEGVFDLFDTTVLPFLTPGLGWNVIYTNFSVLLQVVNRPPGDYNHNGVVDTADYVVWRNTFLQSGPGLVADGNGDGVVDAADYNVWRTHFGQTVGNGAGASAATWLPVIPEPSAGWLLATVIGAILSRRTFRRFV